MTDFIREKDRREAVLELVKKGRCPFLTKEIPLRPARFHA